YENDEQKAKFAEAAKRILEDSGVNRGFALVVDAGDARLAYELARQSELKVYAVDSDAGNVERAREVLSRAGVYGSRVTVHHWEGELPYSNYFANLIVNSAAVGTHTGIGGPVPRTTFRPTLRHLKPMGGV